MKHYLRSPASFLLAALALASAGCGKKEAPKPPEAPAAVQPAPPPAPLAIASIDLGKGVDSMKKVTGGSMTFGVRDTIYASVSTTGIGSNAMIGAKWSFVKKDGTLVSVNESSQTITTSGPAATEFHIAKASAWPKGKYRIEVSLNGAAAGTKDFDVQ
jgi:hypothetical protein